MSGSPKSLAGKVALVTGSGRGIGAGNAIELGARGCNVIVNYANSPGPAAEVVKKIEAHGSKAIAVQADLSNPPEIERLFQEGLKAFGKIDIVMSNSGMEHFGKIEDVTPEEYDQVFNLNTRAQYFVAQNTMKYASEGGRLILMSSITTYARTVRNHAIYSATKAAVEAFVRCLSGDFGVKKITVNAVAPGAIKSDMFAKNSKNYVPKGASTDPVEVEKAIAGWTPLGRVGTPEDVARVVCFLASDDGYWVNGQIITISGGAPL